MLYTCRSRKTSFIFTIRFFVILTRLLQKKKSMMAKKKKKADSNRRYAIEDEPSNAAPGAAERPGFEMSGDSALPG